MGYVWDFSVVVLHPGEWLRGFLVTMVYAVATIAGGLLIGVICGMAMLTHHRAIAAPIHGYVQMFRCTPLLIQIVWFYYALPVVIGVDIPAHVAATLVLSLYTGAFYAEIIRGGVNSIERGQWDAARAIGMRRGQVMRHVILPQAVKRMIPPFMNQSIIQLKNTSLVSTIAVADLLYQGTIITAATYRPLEVYTMVAVIYFLVLFPLTLAAQHVERRLARAD